MNDIDALSDTEMRCRLTRIKSKVKLPRKRRSPFEFLCSAVAHMPLHEQDAICSALDVGLPLADGQVSWAEAVAIYGYRRLQIADREALAKLACERLASADCRPGALLQ